MKKSTIIFIILAIILIGITIYYFTMQKNEGNKCENITCPNNQKCNLVSGDCEPVEELHTIASQNLSGMDKIEYAIQKKLNE